MKVHSDESGCNGARDNESNFTAVEEPCVGLSGKNGS